MTDEFGYTPLTPGQQMHVDNLLSIETDSLAREVLITLKREGLPPNDQWREFLEQYALTGWDVASDAIAWATLAAIAESDWDDGSAYADLKSVETVAQDLGDNAIEGLIVIDAKTGETLLDRTGVVREDGSQYVGMQDHEAKALLAEALSGRDLIFLHNHTEEIGASDADLESAFRAGAKLLIVITHQGQEYVYIRGRYGMVEVRDDKASYEVGPENPEETVKLRIKSEEQEAAFLVDSPELIFLQSSLTVDAVPAGMTVQQANEIYRKDQFIDPIPAEVWKDQWESNPEEWSDFEDLKRLAPFIRRVAEEWHHPESGMSVDAFAALIIASLHLESRYRRENSSANYVGNQIGVLKDKAGDIGQRIFGFNFSLGPANVRPSVADEILGTPENEPFIPLLNDRRVVFDDESRLDPKEEEWRGFAWHDHWGRQKFLNNDENAIVILAANFNRGFERLHRQSVDTELSRYQDDWRPTMFNMLAWANQGIAESYTLSTVPGGTAEFARMHASRGVAFISAIIANGSFGLLIDPNDLVMFNDDDLDAYVRILR